MVDDDEISNFISSKYIQKAGFKSEVYNYPEEAFKYLLNNAPAVDLLLLDINMPNMDGFQFLDEMIKHQLNTKVILLTSSINAADHEKAATYTSVIDFWNKPINFEKLKLLSSTSV